MKKKSTRTNTTMTSKTTSCENCNGACCRWIRFETGGSNRGALEFFRARGCVYADGAWLVPSRCPKLTQEGTCEIQERKPLSCRVFQEGGEVCKQCRKAEGIE